MKKTQAQQPSWIRGKVAALKGSAATAVVLISAVVSVAFASPAEASVFTARVVNNPGYAYVNVRTAPNLSAQIVRTIKAGASVGINCYVTGSTVPGPYGASNLWDRLDDGRWVADALIYTGRNTSVVPPCIQVSDGRKWGKTATRNLAYSNKECTWLALERAKAYSGVYPLTSGNAKAWYTSAGANGWSTSLDAQANSIVVFQPGVYGSAWTGHVGFVTSVERRADGVYIHMDDMNADGRGSVRTNVVRKDINGMSYILLPKK